VTQDEVEKLQKELALLYRVTQSVFRLELDEVLKEIVTVAEEVSAADSVLIYVVSGGEKDLILRASKNPHPALLQKVSLKLGEGITGWVASQQQPVALAEGAGKDPRFKFFHNLPEDRFEAFLSVPIIGRRGVVGVINVQHEKPHAHTGHEINLLAAVGKLVGGAVENALLIEETLALKEALELRKAVEKAKGILMKRRNLTEDEAYKLIQRESMDRRKSIKEICEAILLMDQLEPRH
jgi:uroporphyrinogen-III synthase